MKREKRDSQIIELRREGMKQKDIAERFGLNSEQVRRIFRKYGLPPEQLSRGPINENNLAKRLDELGYDYLGGFTGCDGFVRVRCQRCGREKELSLQGLRHHKYKYCVYCSNDIRLADVREKKAEEKRLAKEQSIKRKIARHEATLARQEQRKQQEKTDRIAKANETPHICRECGKPYLITESWRGRTYCSAECQKKYNDRISRHKRDVRMRSSANAEHIDLKELYSRDKGICHICGKMCDFNDYIIRDETFIAGNNYPSIDHVIPLAKGGQDEWNNVMLAHRRCNSLKRDKLIVRQ